MAGVRRFREQLGTLEEPKDQQHCPRLLPCEQYDVDRKQSLRRRRAELEVPRHTHFSP